MHDPIAHALRDWQTFYLLTGGSAATLAGLLFIAMEFGMGARYPAGAASAIETFVTPTFIRFVDVLVIAALVLIPTETRPTLGALLLVPAVVSVWSIANVLRHSLQDYERSELERGHWIWNVILPIGATILLFVAAVAVLTDQSWALNSLAIAVIALLVTALNNVWRVMTYVARQQRLTREEVAGRDE